MIDFARLSNVIFDKGVRLTEGQFTSVKEQIESEKFTLSEHVIGYKSIDAVYGKIPFKLDDGTTVMVSEETVSVIRELDVDQTKLISYMSESYDNFNKVIAMVLSNQ